MEGHWAQTVRIQQREGESCRVNVLWTKNFCELKMKLKEGWGVEEKKSRTGKAALSYTPKNLLLSQSFLGFLQRLES